MSINWVMMSRDGEVIKLPGEKIYYKVRSRIGLDVSTPKAVPNATPFSIKSDGGVVYITNNRIIYISIYPTETFKSFSAPILDFEDTRVTSSFFGPWTWNAIVKPTIGGGIPSDVPRLELKLTFREGGHDAFQSKFEIMKERLSYARTLQQETGQVIPTGEDLPQYEPPQPDSANGAPSRQQPAPEHQPEHPTASDAKEREALERYAHSQEQQTPRGAVPQDALLSGQVNTSTPNEPPPDYEEAQAQAIGMRFEETMREAADRQ